jgi:hypothetical protein
MIVIMMCALLCAAAASADVESGPNRIGIFADVDGLVNEIDVEEGQPLEVYLLILNPTGTRGLGGFECSIVVPDNVTVWGWNFPMDRPLSIGAAPDFMVVFDPLPYQAVNHVMTFIVVPGNSEPAQFYIEKLAEISSGDAPLYLDAVYHPVASDELIDLIPYPDGPGKASFVVNSGRVPATTEAWGDVKALFR